MAKRKHMVVARTQKAVLDGIQTSKGKLDFGGKTAAWVDDDMASEINVEHGQKGDMDVWVHEDENLTWHNKHEGQTDGRKYGIHHYTFSGVDTKGFRTTKDNGWVWVWNGKKQVRMKKTEALEEGYEVVKKKV